MSENERFYIEANGIWDGFRNNKQLTWGELCDTLNELYEAVDIDKQKLQAELNDIKQENKELKWILEDISQIISKSDKND